jgi:GTP-binding protein
VILDSPRYTWIYVARSTPGTHVPTYKGRMITREEYLEHWGKWVIVEDKERLDELAHELDIAVEHGLIFFIKYLRSADPVFGLDKPVMGVFCDDRERDEVLQMLALVGATPQHWMYERDMFKKWGPGGEFLEKWIASLSLDEKEAEEYRQEVRRQNEAWLDYQYVTRERAGRLRNGLRIWSLEDIYKLPAEKELRSKTPLVAIVGRPNVGKSTLFNQLLGRQQAITGDFPGTTRDRIYADTSWRERKFTLIDAGGLELKPNSDLERKVEGQVEFAIAEADAIIFLIDGREGVTSQDLEIAQMLQGLEKPLIVAANKIDDEKRHGYKALPFRELGLGEPLLISAYYDIGLTELKDELVAKFPPSFPHIDKSNILKLAIVGQPNVGKSMLLNALLRQERAIVEETPGTTRDATDTILYYIDNEPIILIDTAGLRHQSRGRKDIEHYSILQTHRAIDRADIVLLLLDAVEPVTDQDIRIAGYVDKAAKPILVVVNKWDLIKDTREEAAEGIKKEISKRFKSLPNPPILVISAKFKQGIEQILPTAREIFREGMKEIPASLLNNELKKILASHPPPLVKGENLEILYATQAGGTPPTFVFFVNDKNLFRFSYKHYLKNKLHEHFGFRGIPLRLVSKDIGG